MNKLKDSKVILTRVLFLPMINEKIKDRLSDDEIMWLAGMITDQERKVRIKKANGGNSPREPETNTDELRYRPILEWIRRELKTREKPLWPIKKFELNVNPRRVASASGIKRPNNSLAGTYPPCAYVDLAGHDASTDLPLKPQGISYLWDLFHEFGHVLIGSPENAKSVQLYGAKCTVKREKKAWSQGWAAIKKAFGKELTDGDHKSYITRSTVCLEGYRRKNTDDKAECPIVSPIKVREKGLRLEVRRA